MKKIITIVVFSMSYFVFAQVKSGNSSDLWVSYQLNYKKFASEEPSQSTNAMLIVTNQGSLFTLEAMMNFDKIQQERELTEADVLLNKSPFYLVIKTNGESTEHYETIGSDAYKVKENLNHNWKLIKQDTIMNGYVCKKATVNYAGRDWSAWYNPDIPITVGPYKFHGLPGLVMMLKDSENVFSFIVSEVKRGDFPFDSKTENFFIKKNDRKFEYIDKDEFYKIRKKFSEMSLNDKIRFMNRAEIAVPTLIAVGENGDKSRLNAKPKSKNFIERFE